MRIGRRNSENVEVDEPNGALLSLPTCGILLSVNNAGDGTKLGKRFLLKLPIEVRDRQTSFSCSAIKYTTIKAIYTSSL